MATVSDGGRAAHCPAMSSRVCDSAPHTPQSGARGHAGGGRTRGVRAQMGMRHSTHSQLTRHAQDLKSHRAAVRGSNNARCVSRDCVARGGCEILRLNLSSGAAMAHVHVHVGEMRSDKPSTDPSSR